MKDLLYYKDTLFWAVSFFILGEGIFMFFVINCYFCY